ncbi:unnamed protein product [Boreogadus saida]
MAPFTKRRATSAARAVLAAGSRSVEAVPRNAGTGLDPASSQPAVWESHMALWTIVAHTICRPAETAIGWHSWRMALEKRETASHLAASSGP